MAIAAVMAAGLTGCLSDAMSREEVIAAVKQCEEAGMNPALLVNAIDRIVDVQCRIKPTTHQEPEADE